MKPHHKAWLEAHPLRTAEWFERMLGEGFHIHHIDGNYHNNHPGNLCLIEGDDHLRLHGFFGLRPSTINHRDKLIARARNGGLARSKSLSPYQRKMIARRAAQIRWQERQNGGE